MCNNKRNIVECCDICGSCSRRLLFSDKEVLDHGVVICKGCGVKYRDILRSETDLHNSYENVTADEPTDEWISGRIDSFSNYIPLLEKYRKLNRILDVGCGHGFFLNECKKNDWECRGIDVSKKSIEYAQREFDFQVECKTLEQSAFSSGSFDVVILWNVLDEVPSPTELLEEIYRIIRPGGVVIVRVRNASFHIPAHRIIRFMSCFSSGISSWDPSVIHLFSFSSKDLRKLFSKTGFKDYNINNAKMTWTKMNDDERSSFIGKTLIMKLIQTFCSFFYCLSFGKLVLGPSIFLRATKSEIDK